MTTQLETSMTLMSLSTSSERSLTPSPVRGIRLFRAISRKLAKRQRHTSRSSSSDSSKKEEEEVHSADSGFRSVSPSEAGSELQQQKEHSTSAESIRKAFNNLKGKSSSSGGNKEVNKRKKPAPKRILRAPATYTYVRGLSGLPTKRVAKGAPRVANPCGCSVQYMAGLNR